jgi:hypothetical protein
MESSKRSPDGPYFDIQSVPSILSMLAGSGNSAQNQALGYIVKQMQSQSKKIENLKKEVAILKKAIDNHVGKSALQGEGKKSGSKKSPPNKGKKTSPGGSVPPAGGPIAPAAAALRAASSTPSAPTRPPLSPASAPV